VRNNKLVAIPTEVPLGSITPSQSPIVLNAREYKRWMERAPGKLLCIHAWEPRQALDLGEFEVAYLTHVMVGNFPAGRYCSKCGKVDFSHSEGAKEKWKKQDFSC